MSKSKRKNQPSRTKRQEEPISNSLLRSRIEASQRESYKILTENHSVKIKLIKALLIADYPQLIHRMFGEIDLVEILELDLNGLPSTIESIIELASLVLQNNAVGSVRSLKRLYEILSRNEKFIDCAAGFLKKKKITHALIENINFLRNDGKNLLHRAVDMNNLELIQILSELDKSMILQVDDKGRTALHYALAYLKKDIRVVHPNKEIITALTSFRGKRDKSLQVVEILIKSQSNLDNKSINEFILNEFTNQDIDTIDFPEDFASSYVLTETTKKSAKIVAMYWNGLYDTNYSKKDLEIIKEEIVSIITDSSLEHNIDLLNMAFEFFILSVEELTMDNFIKYYAGSTDSKIARIFSPKIKLYILSKLAWYNDANGQNNLALSQSLEAMNLAKPLNDDDLRTFDWYNDAMHKIYLTYVHVYPIVYKDYGNIEVLEAIENAERYALLKSSFGYNIDKFVWYINARRGDDPVLINLVNNIDGEQIKNFLHSLRTAENLLQSELDNLIDKIEDTEKKDLCRYMLDCLRKDYMEDIGNDLITLNRYIEQKDILSMAHICNKSKNAEIIGLAIKSINESSDAFQQAISYELFQISKALIYASSGEFSLAGQLLLDIETKELTNLNSRWKNLFCSLLANLFLNCNQNQEEYITKIEQVDPFYEMLEVMRIQKAEEEPEEVVPSLSLESENPAIQPLTKIEVLTLSEQEFLKECSSGKITPGLQKAYYKQLKQNQLRQDVLCSIKQCTIQNEEKAESWVLDNIVIESNQSQVHHVDGNIWATIDQRTISELDFAYRIAFSNAITKGLAKKEGSNGIKIIGNLAELKIKADFRLYTKIKYINDHGASIIIFNNCGNHDVIERKLKLNKKMNELRVRSISQD